MGFWMLAMTIAVAAGMVVWAAWIVVVWVKSDLHQRAERASRQRHRSPPGD